MIGTIIVLFFIVAWMYAVYCDMRYRKIPIVSQVALLVCGSGMVVCGYIDRLAALLGMCVGLLLLLPTLFHKNVCGGGDIKIIMATGLCFGPIITMMGLCIAILVLYVYTIVQKKTGQVKVPFAPFLALTYVPYAIYLFLTSLPLSVTTYIIKSTQCLI